MLSKVNFDLIYSSGKNEPSKFFLDALINSNFFNLGLGYFCSSGFRALALGFAIFLYKGGKMKFIINDTLTPKDKKAIKSGLVSKPDDIVEINLIKELDDLYNVLTSKEETHFFKCISWLISTKRLEIKAYIPRGNKNGVVHQKFGIFSDEYNNKVVFSGSANFSKTAILSNLESIECHKSWINESSENERINYFNKYFEEIWQGKNPFVKEVSIDNVKEYLREKNKVNDITELIDDEITLLEETEYFKEYKMVYERFKVENKHKLIVADNMTIEKPELSNPYTLRPYQIEAINNWNGNKKIGLFEMATGTGKTITALHAAVESYKENKHSIILISCPYIHLVEQWYEEALKFGLRPFIVAESSNKWIPKLKRELELFKRQTVDLITVITTNVSMSMDSFQMLFKEIWEQTIFIADECHYLGAQNLRNILPQECKIRLGLSATPQRYYDYEGSDILIKYFYKVVYSLPLENAIGEFLTPYYYYPIPIEMTNEEFQEYSDLTRKIQQISNYEDERSQNILEKLAIQRARIQNNSITKVHWVRDNVNNGKDLFYTLFYAGDKIFDPIKKILGTEKKIKIHEFTGEQNRKQRKEILERFSNKKLQALIAMKCLDEGVDIPPTRTAYFLASSGNPREFIQRRGRILRKSEGKDYSIIYDLISIPPFEKINSIFTEEDPAVKSALKKEFKRIEEFSKLAINKNSSFDKIFDIALKLNLLRG